jgi:hypothetical protein
VTFRPAPGDCWLVTCSDTTGATVTAELPVRAAVRLNDGAWLLEFERPGPDVGEFKVMHVIVDPAGVSPNGSAKPVTDRT